MFLALIVVGRIYHFGNDPEKAQPLIVVAEPWGGCGQLTRNPVLTRVFLMSVGRIFDWTIGPPRSAPGPHRRGGAVGRIVGATVIV